jgi:N-acyl homoserine lactone hydrolase
MYELTILIQGFPARSLSNGGLGWSTVSLLSNGEQHILVDTGGFGARTPLLNHLKKIGIHPEDISTILLTHSHWDHMVNWMLFPNADIVMGRAELEWALTHPSAQAHVSELYVRELKVSSRLRLIEDGEEVLPNITAHLTPGHTPGHITFAVNNGEIDLVFAMDVAKNKAELISRKADLTLDAGQSKHSIDFVWRLWEKKSGSLIILGHDLPLVLDKGEIQYSSKRIVKLDAIYGNDPDDFTTII